MDRSENLCFIIFYAIIEKEWRFYYGTKKYGSVGEASREIGVTKTTILNQCNHNVKTKPRCGYYFRYLSEYESKGFVL